MRFKIPKCSLTDRNYEKQKKNFFSNIFEIFPFNYNQTENC